MAADTEASGKRRVGRAPMLAKQPSLWSWGLSHNPGNDSHILGLPPASRYSVAFAAPAGLPPQRTWLREVLSCNFFAFTWAALIGGNMVLLAYDVDAHAREESSPTWLQVMMALIVVLYASEIVLRLYVSRLVFFEDFWNVFDFAWVLADTMVRIVVRVDEDVPLISALRVIGALGRVVRVFRIVMVFKDLYLIVQGMLAALRKILWSSLLVAMILITFSIFAVEFIHPLNVRIAEEGGHGDCERCKQAFQSVMEANLSFVSNALGGDRWDTVCIPIMVQHPWTILVFMSVLFSMQLGLLSLILAVFVDATQRLQMDVEDTCNRRAKQLDQERASLVRLFHSIDLDSAGAISVEKFAKAIDNSKELATFFASMDIHREDLAHTFSLLEVLQVNGSGEMSCSDLIDQLLSLKLLTPQRLLLCNSRSIQAKLTDGVRSMRESSATAHGAHAKQMKQLQELVEKRDSLPVQVQRKAVTIDAGSPEVARELKLSRPKLPDTVEAPTSANGLPSVEEEVQKCVGRLRQSMEEELASITSVVATSLREAAAKCQPPSAVDTGLPGIKEEAGFKVVDEVGPTSSQRAQESARNKNLAVIADQVHKDLLKFQVCINENSSLAAERLGDTFPHDPLARDFQVALVQLQLRLNEGLSMAMQDVITKIHPAAQHHEIAPLGALTAALLHLPPSSRGRAAVGLMAPLAGVCGIGSPSRSGPCCGRRLMIARDPCDPFYDAPLHYE